MFMTPPESQLGFRLGKPNCSTSMNDMAQPSYKCESQSYRHHLQLKIECIHRMTQKQPPSFSLRSESGSLSSPCHQSRVLPENSPDSEAPRFSPARTSIKAPCGSVRVRPLFRPQSINEEKNPTSLSFQTKHTSGFHFFVLF